MAQPLDFVVLVSKFIIRPSNNRRANAPEVKPLTREDISFSACSRALAALDAARLASSTSFVFSSSVALMRVISVSSSLIPSCILSSSSCVSALLSSKPLIFSASFVAVSTRTFRRSWSFFSCSSSNWDLQDNQTSNLWKEGENSSYKCVSRAI